MNKRGQLSHPLGITRALKLSTWARQAGVHPATAYRRFHAGLLPVPARQLATGTILVDPAVSAPGEMAGYARVSSTDQRADLDRQVGWRRRGRSAAVERRASMCARLYGRGSARRRARRAVDAAGEASR